MPKKPNIILILTDHFRPDAVGASMPHLQRLAEEGVQFSKALVSHLDLYPTLLELAVVQSEANHSFWGRSLVPLLRGQTGTHHPRIFAELATAVMVRDAGWKLVYDPEQGGVTHLFNLVVDPLELDNLAGKAGYDGQAGRLIEGMLCQRIRMTQYVHAKEENRLQRVRVP